MSSVNHSNLSFFSASEISIASPRVLGYPLVSYTLMNSLIRPFPHNSIIGILLTICALVSLVMFWSLGVFLLAEVFERVTKDLDASIEQEIGPAVWEYQRDAASCVAQVVECVLSLPAEEAFNLQNGLGAEVPLTAYHVTPSLAITALQRAIESVIDLQLHSCSDDHSSKDDTQFLIPDGIWDRKIDILMKGLMSLDVTIGGSQTCGVALKELMHKYGDILSECWTSGYDS